MEEIYHSRGKKNIGGELGSILYKSIDEGLGEIGKSFRDTFYFYLENIEVKYPNDGNLDFVRFI